MKITITKDGRRKIQDLLRQEMPTGTQRRLGHLYFALTTTIIVNMLESGKEFIEVK